jgi:hypothetical protein
MCILPLRGGDLIEAALVAPAFNDVFNHKRMISSASPKPTMRPPIDSTFASLCSRERRAV